MKTKRILTIFALSFTLLFFFTGSNFAQQEHNPRKNKTLIKFTHKKHLSEDIGASCVDCHSKVPEADSLSADLLPTMDDCGQCHDVEDDNNCNLCHYEDVYELLETAEFKVSFSHKLHVTGQKLECKTCHKGIDKVKYAFESKDYLPQMTTCTQCHNENKDAPIVCSTCHTEDVATLIPETHKSADFLATHKFEAEAKDANCASCHTDNFCEDCHVATTHIDEKNTAKDFFAPYAAHNFKAGLKQQKIQRVHSLDFIYTHGIAAESDQLECRTCHNTETFCVACHQSEPGDFSASGVMPESHKSPNFTTLGVGSGGGEHAVLAQRDIESCEACHDTQGADPVCVKCHVDNDGVKGTNPQTHKPGFMKNVEGDWHYSDGSVCYTCHITASASTGVAGVGFCGYCHGNKPD